MFDGYLNIPLWTDYRDIKQSFTRIFLNSVIIKRNDDQIKFCDHVNLAQLSALVQFTKQS